MKLQFNQHESENQMSLYRQALILRSSAIAVFVALFALPGGIRPLHAQQQASSPSTTWHSDQSMHLIGMPEVKAKLKGSLAISADAMVFTAANESASIDRAEIVDVTTGDVRVETGGTAGKVTRAIIPFGGGSVVATITNKQVDLLTVEFRDHNGALHGAVFLLPKNEAEQAQQHLATPERGITVEQRQPSCPVGTTVHPNTLNVAAITTIADSIPVEYKVLLYEQLLQRLREKAIFANVYRDGDDSTGAVCPEYNFTLTLNSFKKGNAALRASTGPAGLFVCVTSLKFHALVQSPGGNTLLDKDFTVSKRGDSDSLDVTDKIAKSLTTELRKANKHSAHS